MASRRDGPLDYAIVAMMFVLAGLFLTAVFGGPDVLGDWRGVALGAVFIAWFSSQLRHPAPAGRKRVLRIGRVAGVVTAIAGLLSGLFG